MEAAHTCAALRRLLSKAELVASVWTLRSNGRVCDDAGNGELQSGDGDAPVEFLNSLQQVDAHRCRGQNVFSIDRHLSLS